MSILPWDYNLAFGGFQGAQDATALVNYPIDTPVSGGAVESRPMLAWIFSSEEYTELYHQYFTEFINTYFESGYFSGFIDSVREMISPYVEKDPTKFCTYEEYEEGVSTLKEFCLLRASSINGQLEGSIPSTSEQQALDGSTLIDASGISISDMGTMEIGIGAERSMPGSAETGGFDIGAAQKVGGREQGPFSQLPLTEAGDDAQSKDFPTMQENTDISSETGEETDNTALPANEGFSEWKMPDRGITSNPEGTGETGQERWILLIASPVVLLAGIAFAALYKRRG